MVQAVLDAASDDQLITIGVTDGFRRIGLEIADVKLILPDGRVLQALIDRARPDQYRVNTALPGDRLQPGAEYGLRIVEGSAVVTGATRIPDAQPVSNTSASQPFSRGADTLSLAWPRVAGARAYHVAVQHDSRFSFNPVYYFTFADTSIVLAGTRRTLDNDQLFEEGEETVVVVSAVDDNFYTYYHAQLDPFAGAPPSRLSGALGVFGSIVPILVRRLDVIP